MRSATVANNIADSCRLAPMKSIVNARVMSFINEDIFINIWDRLLHKTDERHSINSGVVIFNAPVCQQDT